MKQSFELVLTPNQVPGVHELKAFTFIVRTVGHGRAGWSTMRPPAGSREGVVSDTQVEGTK